jgi:molybdopterin-containing oxidoreductase family iron-sulfur binding subunit
MGQLVQLKGLRRSDKESSAPAPNDSMSIVGSQADAQSEMHPSSGDGQGSEPATHHYSLSTIHYPPSPDHRPYWRSLEELASSSEYDEWLHREFPNNASEWTGDVGRRTFLKLMGASLALGGLTACTRQPAEHIAPYVRQPEEILPGRPLFFATSMPLGGFGCGVIVKSNEGRPTKVEGNPDHPASLGGTDLFAQASVLGLYDPDRSQTLTYLGDIVTWSAFLGAMRSQMDLQRQLSTSTPNGTSGLRILTGAITSPTLASQINELLAAVPGAKWHQYEPAGRSNALEGSKLAFGQYAGAVYQFDKADVILSLDADFLGSGPGRSRYARDFSNKRRLDDNGRDNMSRLYVVESTVSITGAVADHRFPVRPGRIESFARAIALELGLSAALPGAEPPSAADANLAKRIADDLKKSRGRCLVIAGESQHPVVHALAHAMNDALGNAGATVLYTEPVEANPVDEIASLTELVAEMDAGRVSLLVILGGNPVYDTPADLDFVEKLKKVPTRVHLSLYKDETSQLCQWHIPEAHYLESWSDIRAYDGTSSIVQPLIAPLYASCRTSHEVLAAFSNQPERKSYDIVRDYWRSRPAGGGPNGGGARSNGPVNRPTPGAAQQAPVPPGAPQAATPPPPARRATSSSPAPQAATPAAATPAAASRPQTDAANAEFDKRWRKWLHDGVVENSTPATKVVASKSDWLNQPQWSKLRATDSSSIEIVFRPDPTVHDGRFANNGWLQELPKPITKLSWDNAALVGPDLARRLGLGTTSEGRISNRIGMTGGEIIADLVEIDYQGRKLTAPAFIVPGIPDGTVTVYLGYGRTDGGRVGTGAGFNAYKLRTSTQEWFGPGAQVIKAGGEQIIATTQTHHAIDESIVGKRDLIRSSTLDEYRAPQDHGSEGGHAGEHPSLFPAFEYKDYAWGMSIDLNSCIGCSACVVACQSENNIPVVGREQVLRRREMHWLRVDAYYRGEEANPETYFQPVPCQQCENAPCEVVCPVAATTHSAEGLNDMVYNRCVGTRYCSNNCPYKVRRFNFLLFQDFTTASLKMMRNPDVTVRSRGVMEKCTYCVQRIQRAKIEAEKEDRLVRDGEIATACEAACPTQAIVFGNINDHASRVAKLKAQKRNYNLLDELNTRPRTTYLGVVKNPNPEIQS